MHYFLQILDKEGHRVAPGDNVLDLGCGNGSLVQALREDGVNAEGCDIKFKEGPHAHALEQKGVIRKIAMPQYRLPYDDNSFDYIVSETVFEHVKNTDATIAEIHRVLKPGGISLHYFPSRYGLVENHVHVPLASVFRSYPYLWLWAVLGVRKKKQRGLQASAVARMNKEYLENSTHYLTTRQIREAFGRRFPEVRFVEKTAIRHSTSRLTVLLAKGLFFVPFLPYLYRTFKAVVVMTRKEGGKDE